MVKYPKINSIFKRDDNGRFTDEFSCQEFDYLQDNEWVFYEKIDGTNTQIGWDGLHVSIDGRTNRTQIQAELHEFLTSTFTLSKFYNRLDPGIILYGEGYGRKIQKVGSKYIPDGVGFILFDVKVDDWWLKRVDVEELAKEFEIPVVPIRGSGRLETACKIAEEGFDSNFGACQAEGLVLHPMIDGLQNRAGHRIITKVKTKDFK